MADVTIGPSSFARWATSADLTGTAVIAGQTSFEASGAADILGELDSQPHVERVTTPVPTEAEVNAITDRVRHLAPERILAVGGGLVLDTAKLVSISLTTGGDARSLTAIASLGDASSVELVAVPTTAGSGSERTPFAVLYLDGHKTSIDLPQVEPDVAVIDPTLMYSAPAGVAASSGLDALAHCMESAWAVRSTSSSRELALDTLKIVWESLEAAVAGSEEARDRMSSAASDAGVAISTTRTTAAHAMSYHLTYVYGIPHGHAVGLTLGQLLILNAQIDDASNIDERGPEPVREVIAAICQCLGAGDAAEAGQALTDKMKAVGLATTADGVSVDDWVGSVETNRLSNNPRRLSEPELRAMTVPL